MADTTAWPAKALPSAVPPLQAETEADRLRIALSEVEADLRRYKAAVSKLQDALMVARHEVAGARGETVQFKAMLERAQAVAPAALARIAILETEAIGRDAEIMRLQVETQALRAGIDVLRASFSWRISAPVRVAGGLIRALRPRRSRRASAEAEPAPAPPAPLPAPVFNAAPQVGAAEGVVTLDALYQLSRTL
jgi:hypothetical protein